MQNKQKIAQLVVFSMLWAILTIFAFTPLGSIPIGPIVATLAMLPVVIASLILGLKFGLLMGFCFGLYSLIYFTINPSPFSFIFSPFANFMGHKGSIFSLIVCFVPRIFIAITTYYSYSLSKGLFKTNYIRLFVSSFIGSFTNTILFIILTALFFGQVQINNVALSSIIISSVLINGLAEALLCSFVAPIIYQIHHKLMKGVLR